MTDELSEGQTKIIDKIKKLLNHAAGAGTPEEAATYQERANALLLEYNLDAGAVERAGDDDKRVDEKVEGGFHAFHREIWGAVAQLNFCIYWSQKFRKEETKHVFDSSGRSTGERTTTTNKRRHALVGRTVNVRSTIAMAGYLCEAIERILKEELSGRDNSPYLYSTWSNDFRRGASADIVGRLRDRRREAVRKEERAQKAAEHEGKGSNSRAMTIAGLTQSEKDANNDFLYGEGWSAKRRAEAAEAKREDDRVRKGMEDAYTAWAAAHPKEAKSHFKWADAKTGEIWSYGSSSRSSGGGSRGRDIANYGAYSAGSKRGAGISLDQQMGTGNKATARIGR